MQYIIQTTKSQQFINITNKVAEEVAKAIYEMELQLYLYPYNSRCYHK